MRIGTTHWLSQKFPDDYVHFFREQMQGKSVTVLGNGTDYDEPLKTALRGWCAKLEWFAPWNAHLRPALVIDLDTYIVGDIDPLLKLHPSKLWMIREFLGKPERRRAESGIFAAPSDEGFCNQIWEAAQGWNGTDGELMRQFPHSIMSDYVDGILSYKGHRLQDKYPEHARVVCFHGKPKPPDTTGWALEWWQNFLL